MQALVIVEHRSGQFNMYLSDMEGVIFSLSLPDIVIEDDGYDIEVVRGVCECVCVCVCVWVCVCVCVSV